MKKEYAEAYSNYEKNHWWFKARRIILKSLLAHELSWHTGHRVLEVGVGPGENLYSIYPPSADLVGLEPDPGNASLANHRGNIPVYAGTLDNIPTEIQNRTFQLISLFDVLEHIEDDHQALRTLHTMIEPGGVLALTVPAYMWMWGQQDVVNLHYRRYTLRELVAKLEQAGFRIQRASYFNTLLFPPISMWRLLAKCRRTSKKPQEARTDFEYRAGCLEPLFFRIFAAEAYALQYTDFPFGVSAFVFATKAIDNPKR